MQPSTCVLALSALLVVQAVWSSGRGSADGADGVAGNVGAVAAYVAGSPNPVVYASCGDLSKCITKSAPGSTNRSFVRKLCRAVLQSAFDGVQSCTDLRRKCRWVYVETDHGLEGKWRCRDVSKPGFQCRCAEPSDNDSAAASPSPSSSVP